MSIRVTQNSFSRGVISPSLYGRYDLEQYSYGLKKINNGIVLQEGYVSNRAGLEFIEQTKYNDKKCRLIPFNFGENQNYIIEVGEKYFRFIYEGNYILKDDVILEIETPYLEEDLFKLDYVQQADVITFVHKKYKPYELSRYSHNSWTFTQISLNASISPPVTVSSSYTGSTSSNTTTYKYLVCAVDSDTNEESKKSAITSVTAHKEAYWTTSEYVTISWSEVANACEYNIYKCTNGIYGYIGTSTELTFIDNNIEADLTSCAPNYKNPFANQNPSCVCYYQQRKVYASSETNPQNIWASQSGTNNNFNVSRPVNSTDALDLQLYDNISSPIQHLIPFDDLIVMTTNAEWAVNGSDGIFCANPTPVAKLQSFYGSSKIKPIISGSMVLFVQSSGNIVRDLGYNYLSDSYDGEELSICASHLFENKTIVDMAYAKEPHRIVWCVMDDGTVNGLTYNPKQKICAWHTHTTDGEFESVATIKEDNFDVTYFVVKRTVNSNVVRYIERIKSRAIKNADDLVFLDSYIDTTFENEVENISGLSHLANCEVIAILDNDICKNLKVDENGVLKLPHKAKSVKIGLAYKFELETLNIEGEGSLGLIKTINKVEVKTYNSREDFLIVNDNNIQSSNQRSLESYQNPTKLYSRDVVFNLLSEPSKEVSVKIAQDSPLPLSILAISSTFNIESVEQQ